MNKMERFLKASRGEKVDTPPVGSWIHFGSALWQPRLVADVHLQFLKDYDWDYIKVMDDYRFPTVGNIGEAKTAEDLKVVGSPDLKYDNFDRQVEVLRLIRDDAPGVPIVDTVFSPFQTVIRTVGDSAVELLRANPEVAKEVLNNVAQRLIEFLKSTEGLSDGIHFSVNGASADWHGWGVTEAEFNEWIAPYDKAVLEAAEGRVRIMHVHGYDLTEQWVDDYPVEVMSWSHNQSHPTLAEVAQGGKFVPMGGLDEVGCLYWAPSKVRENVLASRRETGDKIIVAPGCTVHSDTPPAVLRELVTAARLPL